MTTRLEADQAICLLVDIQERLTPAMHDPEALTHTVDILLTAVRKLEVPLLATEQVPEKLGPTLPALAAHLAGDGVFSKSAFSACGSQTFCDALASSGRKQVVLAGIETHVCVLQTAIDLLSGGYQVHVVADAVSSRTTANRELALERMRAAGAIVTCVESVLFELMRDATHPAFRDVSRLIR